MKVVAMRIASQDQQSFAIFTPECPHRRYCAQGSIGQYRSCRFADNKLNQYTHVKTSTVFCEFDCKARDNPPVIQ